MMMQQCSPLNPKQKFDYWQEAPALVLNYLLFPTLTHTHVTMALLKTTAHYSTAGLFLSHRQLWVYFDPQWMVWSTSETVTFLCSHSWKMNTQMNCNPFTQTHTQTHTYSLRSSKPDKLHCWQSTNFMLLVQIPVCYFTVLTYIQVSSKGSWSLYLCKCSVWQVKQFVCVQTLL